MNTSKKEYSFGAYEVLGIKADANLIQIKNAYRRKVMKNHPDRGGNVVLFQEIQSAYMVLSDPDKRTLHDSLFKGYDVAELIKHVRKEMGLTQVELADYLGITQKTVVFYEQGKFKPRRRIVERLIKIASKRGVFLSMEDFGF